MIAINTHTMTVNDLLVRATARLAQTSSSPRLDAEVLLAYALNRPRTWLHAHSDSTLSNNSVAAAQQLLDRRATREPIAYILGEQEFYGRSFRVTPATLIPRPESELLIDQVKQFAAHASRPPARIADVGTGSGALAVTIAKELRTPFVWASDISEKALAIAEENAKRHDVDALFTFRHGFLLNDHTQALDVVVANLPYVTETRFRLTEADVREHEPKMALVPSPDDADGLSLYRALLQQLPERVCPGGAVFFEADPEQMPALRRLTQDAFPGGRIEVYRDLRELERVLACYL